MSNEPSPNSARVRDIFLEALEKPSPEARNIFLVEACQGDPALRAAVDKLLSGHLEDTFLETPAANPRGIPPVRGPHGTIPLSGEIRGPGDRIGRYKLLQEIGEGGWGTVYMAEQEEPVRRRVALKIIKLGMDTKSVIARFEAERQALALMDHPNIARVLDAGTTDTGRPYFVMELVRGIRITDYCNQHQLPIGDRLRLFINVCQAIQHAHQKGIIHRDIKPSNILVTLHDGVPLPKVIDFGIAKAFDQRLTEKTVFTRFQAFIGTPAYMSPEQAEMSGLDIDTRSDIYSLGVLLYELLVGTTPFDADELDSLSLDDLRRIIREKEPLRPSTRLKTMVNAERVRTTGHPPPDMARLSLAIRGDLDWIVMKALEKDRTRRYETASALAGDIQRHLNNEPVLARPASQIYRFRKFARRNKLAFAAATAFAIALLVGLGLSTWQYLEKSEAYERVVAAEAERERSLNAARTAQANEALLRQQAEAQALNARRKAYAADVTLAQQAIIANNYGRAQDLLNDHHPAGSEPDLRGWEWRYLWQQCQSDALLELCRQTNEIGSLSVSADGKLVAFSGGSGNVAVWDLRARKEVVRLAAGFGRVLAAFSPNAPLLAFTAMERPGPPPGTPGPASAGPAPSGPAPSGPASAGPASFGPGPGGTRGMGGPPNWTQRIQLWDAAKRRPAGEFKVPGFCRTLAFSRDGATLVIVSGDKSVIFWDVAAGTVRATHALPDLERFGAVLVSPDLRHVAHAIAGGRLRLFDREANRELWTAETGEENVMTFAFSPDGRTLASGGGFTESPIRLWDVATGRERARLEGHRGWISALFFLPDGNTLVSASGDHSIRIWNVAEARSGPVMALHGHKLEVLSVALLPDKSTLVSGGKDGVIYLWDLTSPPSEARHILVRATALAWRFTPDSAALLTVDRQGRVTRWPGPDFATPDPLFTTSTNIANATFSRDGSLFATGSPSGAVEIWHVPAKTRVQELRPETGRAVPWTFVRGTNAIVLRQGRGNNFHVWDLATGQETHSWRGGMEQPGRSSPGHASANQAFLWADEEGTVHLQDLAAGSETQFPFNLRQLSQVSFASDGRRFAVVSQLDAGVVWDVALNQQVFALEGFLQGMHSAAFSPDGKRLVVGGNGKEAVKLWDVESHQELLTLEGQGSFFRSVGFSPDGNLLGAGNVAGEIHIWRAPPPAQLATARPGNRP